MLNGSKEQNYQALFPGQTEELSWWGGLTDIRIRYIRGSNSLFWAKAQGFLLCFLWRGFSFQSRALGVCAASQTSCLYEKTWCKEQVSLSQIVTSFSEYRLCTLKPDFFFHLNYKMLYGSYLNTFFFHLNFFYHLKYEKKNVKGVKCRIVKTFSITFFL